MTRNKFLLALTALTAAAALVAGCSSDKTDDSNDTGTTTAAADDTADQTAAADDQADGETDSDSAALLAGSDLPEDYGNVSAVCDYFMGLSATALQDAAQIPEVYTGAADVAGGQFRDDLLLFVQGYEAMQSAAEDPSVLEGFDSTAYSEAGERVAQAVALCGTAVG
ncbi:MAG: hypothetical protein LBR19_03265 [Bifidobacteriaceae bacterium]|jgi:hypothetical protein|nr:hypothetical protein [Bifidobacteriaceae bacterium]